MTVPDNYRYYCNNDKCRWLDPDNQEKIKAIVPDAIDCTDMTDDEFCEFLDNETKK